ncbi:MAG: Smr/MutS family protein [Spirosomataceae bacterium]
MNIGDKVRLLHGKEEGVITRLLQGNLVEVEIEEGFKIPVQKNELAVVSDEEIRRFKPELLKENPSKSGSSSIIANAGLYMAFVSLNDRELALHLINNTDWDIAFTLTQGSEPHFKGLRAGILQPKTAIKIQDLAVKDFEEWGTFTYRALYYRPAFMVEREPLTRKMKFRANTFFKNKQKAPVLGKDAYVFQLDAETQVINPEKLAEKLTTPTPKPIVVPPKPLAVVDLHIEKLSKDFLAMGNTQKLDLQLQVFETQLENAIANAMSEITFIHGIGNGTLRDELHRRLGRNRHVKYFADSQKEKFGYGATKVTLA